MMQIRRRTNLLLARHLYEPAPDTENCGGRMEFQIAARLCGTTCGFGLSNRMALI